MATVSVVLATLACGSDDVISPPPSIFTATLEGPAPVSAAVIEIVGGVESVVVDGGVAFGEVRGTTFRAVLLLAEPGELRFRFGAGPSGADVSIVLVELADANETLVPSLEGYAFRVER